METKTINQKTKINLKDTFKNLKATWPYAKRYKKYLTLFIILSLAIVIIGVITPLLSAKLLLNMTDGLLSKVIFLSCVILAVELMRNLIRFFSRILINKFYYSVLNDLQKDIAEETLKLDIREIDANSSGVFIDRITKDAGELSDVFNLLIIYFSDIMTDIGVLGAIFLISKTMFIYCIFALFIIFWLERLRIKAWYDRNKIIKQLNEKNSGLIGELVRGIRDIKVLNAAKDFMNKTVERIKDANNKKIALNLNQQKYTLVTGSLRDLSDFMFIVLGIILIKTNNLSIDNMVIIFMYRSRMYNLLSSITRFTEQMKRFTLSSNRVFEIINGNFKKEKFGTKHLNKIEGNFEFKNVTFGYNEDRPVLKNLSFKVKANETVAFVGKSGGGKTTVFSLIDRLYKINKGQITIDGVNIDELDKDSIRDNISIITQSPYIFNFTIKENLLITKSNATDKEIEDVCKIAQLHDFIMSLPDKYDTLIGEGGLNLSGGQRQRLAIARALLKKTEIILFDEATSALDNETQRGIQKAINNMKGEYTILIIAHRLSTVIDADRLLLIDDGKVVAEGTHEKLLKTNKIYQELYKTELQS